MDPDVPLIVPEVNADAVSGRRFGYLYYEKITISYSAQRLM